MGLSLCKIAQKCEISKSSVAQICGRTSNQRSKVDKVSCKSSLPRKISERDGRALIRRLRGQDVTVKTVVKESGCSFQQAHHWTFSRFLNKKRYGYLTGRRKGILSEKDRRIHLQYTRKMKCELSRNPDFFKHDIAFILMVFSFTSAIPYRHWPEQKAEYGGRKMKVYNLLRKGLKTWLVDLSCIY